MNSDFSTLTLAEAKKLLKRYSLASYSPAKMLGDRDLDPLYAYDDLRQALELVARHSEYQILGVCAENSAEGLQALNEYSRALGYEPPQDIESIVGSVYIKFNPRGGWRYMSAYEGRERGVLVSCQSPNSDGINEMYGHLPLDLFVAKIDEE
jgi:Domain of unknown function (DUF1824)